MPVEIRELVIRATVEPPAGDRDGAPAGGALDDAARARIVQDCVAEVMRQLRRAQEP